MFGQAGLLDDAPPPRDEDRNTLLGDAQAQDDREAGPSAATKSAFGGFEENGLLSGGDPFLEERRPSPSPPSPVFGTSSLLSSPRPTTNKTSSTSYVPNPKYNVRATTFNGKSVYIRKRVKLNHEARERQLNGHSGDIGNLLDMPLHRLRDQISLDTATRLQAHENFIAATAASASASTSRSSTSRPTASIFNRASTSTAPTAPVEPEEETLWVDRYRPTRFTELIGNERSARDVMAWVKQWDWCVFGHRKGKKRPREENTEGMDEYHRPQEKLLLMSGPPGLGKTTLAHVVARHAGYEVMEINASDARSGTEVEDRIRPALESGSAVGSKKPVLLVIDEIDGATGADNSSSFIHKLVQLTKDEPSKKRRPGQKRDPKTARPILRPIICICNDPNASALAKLRPQALHVRLQRPADAHIVKRLRQICELEALRADSQALSALVAVARGDMRGCLNTLQFIKARSAEVNLAMVRSATVGMKQAETSVQSVLNNLFAPMSKRRVKELGLTEAEESKYVARLSHEVDASGRESGVAVGCFAHYASLRQHDATLDRFEKANDWLGAFDAFSAAMWGDGEFALAPYLPYTLVAFYPLFQERGAPKVERSSDDWEALQMTRANEEIYKTFSQCLRVAGSRHGGAFRHLAIQPALQLEAAPFINRIISPHLRPVNKQIIKPAERAVMARLVGLMAAMEFRFLPERGEDGQLSYRLEPPIDVFITYDGKRAADIPASRYAVRQMIELAITRQAEVVQKDATGKASVFNPTVKSSAQANGAAPEHPNKRAKKDVAAPVEKEKVAVDFFGRPITKVSATQSKAAVRRNVEKRYRVSFKYAEGNSAAVRRPTKVSAFLP
ncbi:P-loop containing nucleoside triphosphate hydrolase protein [Schizophyllum commune]